MASHQSITENPGEDQFGKPRNISPPKRQRDCYWPRSKTLFVIAVADENLDTGDVYDFMCQFGKITIFSKNQTGVRLIPATKQYSHLYFSKFREEMAAANCLQYYGLESPFHKVKTQDLLGNLKVYRPPANPDFECIGDNNQSDYGCDQFGQPRNIGASKSKPKGWPGDRNMYVSVETSTEPDMIELYDIMRIYGKIVRFNKDKTYQAKDGTAWHGYWCCYRYRRSAKTAFKRPQNEWKTHGNSLFIDLKIAYSKDYTK